MGQKRADAHHMRLELLQKDQIFSQSFCSLPRRANHKAGTYLEADFFQCPEALLAACQRQCGRVQAVVVGFVRRFMAQQITVRTSIEKGLIDAPVAFAHGEGKCTVAPAFFDCFHCLAEQIVGKAGVLAALEHESAKAQIIPFGAAGENIFRCEPVALRFALLRRMPQ